MTIPAVARAGEGELGGEGHAQGGRLGGSGAHPSGSLSVRDLGTNDNGLCDKVLGVRSRRLGVYAGCLTRTTRGVHLLLYTCGKYLINNCVL